MLHAAGAAQSRISRTGATRRSSPGVSSGGMACGLAAPNDLIAAMRQPFIVQLLAFGLLLCSGLPAQEEAEITWHRDFDAARRLATERGAPLFVVFRCEP